MVTACSGSGTGAGGGGGSDRSSSPERHRGQAVLRVAFDAVLLSAMESGYAGSYTAVKISGQCFKVEPPATSPGYWTVAPGGGLCIGGNQGDVEEFRGDRQECQGNSAE